jgi:glutathione synthase/RimK-type ligase-like ATP-grasp enzyme
LETVIHLAGEAELKQSAIGENVHCFHDDSTFASFLKSTLNSEKTSRTPSALTARFLFSSVTGYVIRSDLLERRLECSEYISQAVSFLAPRQKVVGVGLKSDLSDLEALELFDSALGVTLIHPDALPENVGNDLQNRLSAPFLHPDPIPLRRIAWVQGREDIDCISRALEAAKALGIKLVILDEPGHWLQDPKSPWAQLREAFIETDITADEGLADRVVDALRGYPEKVDGIVTISDVRLPAIARACEMLGLPTEQSEAYDIAGDKGRTRMLEPSSLVDESFSLSSADELEPYLARRVRPLQFPLVVKPVVGWCSDCVSRVSSVSELTAAVRNASLRHAQAAKPSTAVVVEPYVDGPEVDANFVLLNGEVLFCDINDDFPSPADEPGADAKANFQETQNVIPSGLPRVELDVIKENIVRSIKRQGFRSGVFHCEARVRNSSMRYTEKDGGIVDLVQTKQEAEEGDIEVYLHEVNARPPGYLESVAVLLAYGVDYYALRLLLALPSTEETTYRLRALSQSFKRGSQFHLSIMIIQQSRAGIMKTADAAKAFLEKHPHMRECVVDYYTRKKNGDVLEGPDAAALWWIAYFSVVSRASRRELLERVDYIQRHFEYEIEV